MWSIPAMSSLSKSASIDSHPCLRARGGRGRTATAATLRRGKEGNRRFDLVRQYELMVFEATCPRIFDQFLLDKAAGRSTGLRCIYFNLGSNSRPSLCKKGCTKTRSKAKAPWGQMWLPGTIMVEKAETSSPTRPTSCPKLSSSDDRICI